MRVSLYTICILPDESVLCFPVLQTALVAIGYPGPVEKQGFHFNMYTAPAFLSAILAVTNLILLVIFFRLHRIEDNPNAVINDSDNDKGVLLLLVLCNYWFRASSPLSPSSSSLPPSQSSLLLLFLLQQPLLLLLLLLLL